MANFDLETVEKPSSTFRLAQTVPTNTVNTHIVLTVCIHHVLGTKMWAILFGCQVNILKF